MTRLNWNKRNMDIVVEETANDRDKRYIYAIAVAVQYILEWIKKNGKEI